MKASVYCITKTGTQTENIIAELRTAGFTSDSISVLLPDTGTSKDFAHEKSTKAPEGAVTGGAAGMGIGAALGWLAGIGTLAIPGLGPFIAAGPIMAALSGAAAGAALGGLTGALIGMGIPEYEAKRYEGKVREGNILVSVHTDDRDERTRARRILEEAGAEDVADTAEARV